VSDQLAGPHTMEVRFHGRGGQGVVTAAARPMVRPAEDERVTRLHATAEHPDLETLTHSARVPVPRTTFGGANHGHRTERSASTEGRSMSGLSPVGLSIT
jgi:hypothetical protein